jgi:hypothetical protein
MADGTHVPLALLKQDNSFAKLASPDERFEPDSVDLAIATESFCRQRLWPVRALAHCENVTV